MPERPRFPVGQKFRYRVTGSTWEIIADHHFHPNVMRSAQIVDDRYYVVEIGDHHSIMFHGVIEDACDPIDDEPPGSNEETPET